MTSFAHQYRLPRELNDWLVERARNKSRSKNGQLFVELRVRRAELKDRSSQEESQVPVVAISQ
jgi:hypothetical protein